MIKWIELDYVLKKSAENYFFYTTREHFYTLFVFVRKN